MAELDYGGINSMSLDILDSGKITKLVNAAGAVMSLALIAGVSIWGYQLLMRDVTGVPVVQALDGPMRVQPNDPGGILADHQGLAVNDVRSEGVAAAAADRLVLAPDAAGIYDDDAAGLMRPAPRGYGMISSQTDAAVAEALALATDLSDEASVTLNIQIIPTSVPGVRRSMRPILRPVRLDTTPATASVEMAAAQASMAPVRDVDPNTIAVGTRLVQLGTYESTDAAQRAWQQMATNFSGYMHDKSRVIQEGQGGGRTFYRLRVMGFDELSDARQFCSPFLAKNATCIPVMVR